MAVEVERLLVTLEARLDTYNKNLTQAQAITNQRLNQMEARFAKWSANLKNSASTAAMGIGSVFSGIGSYLGAQAVIEYANEWTRLTRSIDGSSRVFGITLKSAGELTKLANESRIDVDAYAKTYIRTAAAIRDFGYDSTTAANVTSTLAKALKLGSASASEQASTILQFSQALQKGKLDGDEFRTVMENAGVVQELLAERLKVSKGELLKMAAEGKIPLKDLVGAMVDGAARIDRIFAQMPVTVDEAFTVLRNNVVQFLGQMDQATGASQSLAQGLVVISQNLGAVAVAAGAVLSSAAVRMVAFAAATIAAANPVTLLAAALGGLATGYAVFAGDIKTTDDGFTSLKDSVQAFADVLGGDAKAALGSALSDLKDVGQAYFDFATRNLGLAYNSVADAAAGLAKRAIDLDKQFGGVGATIVNAFTEGGKAIAQTIGLTDALSYSLDAANRVADRAQQIALARGIEQADWGAGLRDARDGKKSYVAKPMGSASSQTGKRSEYQREVDQIIKRTAALNAEIATIGQSTLAQEKAKAAAELRAAAAATAAKEGRRVTVEELTAIDKLSTAYAEAQVQAQFLGKLQAERDNTTALRSELSLIGLQGEALEKARIEQELLNEAKKAGLELTPERRAKIEEVAGENAALRQQVAIINDVRDQSREALKGFISDMREGKGATEALSNALDRMADKLFDMGVNGLVESALGGLLGGGGGLSGIFGGGSSRATTTGWGTSVLPTFAKGGISNGPAIFGEAGPEAAVPLPNGQEIPVDLRMPPIKMPTLSAAAAPTNVNLNLNIDARGATKEAVASMNADLVPTIQKVVKSTVNQMFDRDARFARSGV